ncbi:UNVERIFIED_CONTAM: hypothetical protein Slati_2317500 [Sesamum latifolium]|uniref:CRAL-TRIO domain-containing protein n=1 Tax=Sesamum latifolium TaxID=2727402 RepID=A0AAW2WDS1_9LAMI
MLLKNRKAHQEARDLQDSRQGQAWPPLLRIIGKLFPARLVSVDTLKKYLEDEIFPGLEGRPFSVVYVHTEVNRGENFPGISV